MIEYHNKAYVLFEIKYRDAKVPTGQLKALVRSVDDFKSAKKSALLVIAEHDIDDPAILTPQNVKFAFGMTVLGNNSTRH